jgi:hypothetical protein
MAEPIGPMNESQLRAIEGFKVAKNWPGMYKYIADGIADNSIQVPGGTSSKTYFWFSQSVAINGNNGTSPAAAFIRGVAKSGMEYGTNGSDGSTPAPGFISKVSNEIASNVAEEILKGKGIPDFTTQLSKDISVSFKMGISLGGWGGSFYHWNDVYINEEGVGKTVGAWIMSTPGEYEKFIAVNGKVMADLVQNADRYTQDGSVAALFNTYKQATLNVLDDPLPGGNGFHAGNAYRAIVLRATAELAARGVGNAILDAMGSQLDDSTPIDFEDLPKATHSHEGRNHSAPAESTDSTDTTNPTRPASSTFITPVDDTHVTLSQGGTVSDIVREQNKAGNPITADDVRAANPDLNINDKFTNVRAGDVLQIPKRVGDNLVTSIEGGGTRSVNTKTNEITTVVPNADGTTTQTTSSTDGEFGRTVRTLVYDTKTGDVIREQREAINLLDNTRTPLDANGQPLTQPAPPTPATHAHSGGGGADEADSFDDFDGGDGDEDETAATTEAAYAQLVEAFSAPQEQHQDPHAVLLADAGTYTTSNTIVSDAGGGGKANTEFQSADAVNGSDLQSDQASAAITAANDLAQIRTYDQAFAASNQFNSMTRNWEHMSDAQRITGLMTLYNQIDNLATNTASTFLPDGTPTGHAKAGDNLPGSVSTPLAWVNMATTIDSMSQ